MNTIDEIETLIKKCRSEGDRRVVFVSGIFNVLHPGHLRLLKFAKDQGDVLIVGVYSDARAESAVIDEEDRLDGVSAISYVDRAFLMSESTQVAIQRLKPDIVIKGKEWAGCENPEEDVIKGYGGKLLFCSGEVTFSSLDLIREEFKRRESFPIRPSDGYLQRHNIDVQKLRNVLMMFNNLNVVVLGDTIIDEYIMCDALGMSQEEPVLVVRPLTTEKFVGGAGIVAMHARGLGANVKFLSVLGYDEAGKSAGKMIAARNIETHFLKDTTRPTTVKQRFISQGKKLLRVSYLREHSLNKELIAEFSIRLSDVLKEADLVIFSDFNYGFLCEEVREAAVSLCRKFGVKMAADCQSSSQIGDVTRYVGMNLVTPNEREARLALHDKDSGLVVLARRLEQKMQAKELLMTLGNEGVLIHHPTPEDYKTDRLPALNNNPRDVMGAGDALLVGASMTLASDHDIWTAAYIGALCAAYEVASFGNQPLLQKDILGFLNKELS